MVYSCWAAFFWWNRHAAPVHRMSRKVSEHFARNYDSDWLNGTFAKAIFIGNGLVSIIAGLLANYLVTDMGLDPRDAL